MNFVTLLVSSFGSVKVLFISHAGLLHNVNFLLSLYLYLFPYVLIFMSATLSINKIDLSSVPRRHLLGSCAYYIHVSRYHPLLMLIYIRPIF